jgi:hypothetical protein
LSQLLIQKYLNDLSDLRRVSGSKRESVVSEAFKTLLKEWGKSVGLLFIPQYERPTIQGDRRYMDGALVEPQLRMPFDTDGVIALITGRKPFTKSSYDGFRNRSAIEWILDQYKEKTPKDPTIREKFNTYRFADYKDHVIDLLKRVTRVSVETQEIVSEMASAKNIR